MAADLMTCRLAEDDLVQVIVSESSEGLFLQEVRKHGMTTQTPITREEWDSQNIRLSSNSFGFRFLRYTYSEFFNETGWFVEAGGGMSYSISRADCR